MKYYIASGLENAERVNAAAAKLDSLGGQRTYDWTAHGDVRKAGEARMREVSEREIAAVTEAELFLALLPGGKGTHTELGAALATISNKRVVLWSETGLEFEAGASSCVFYRYPEVVRLCCPFDILLAMVHML